MKNYSRAVPYLFILFFLSSCAQIISPTGGEKDITPPKMLWATPEAESTNFNEDLIRIEFNEYIQFKEFKDQFLVSPPLKYPAEVEIRGKELLIGIEDTLRKNTTYVFNFGNSIVDLNESNPFGNFKYVFSTGPELDSLHISGLVADAYSLKTEKAILVMLYSQNEDSIPYKALPNYVSRTDEDGKFHISNIKKGNYKIFALADKNNNYLFDRPDEKIAFQKELVSVDNSKKDSIYLYLFEEENPLKYIKDKSVVRNSYQLVFSRTTDSIYLEAVDKNTIPPHYKEFSQQKDTLNIWFKNLSEDLDFEAVIKDREFIYDSLRIKVPALGNDSLLKLRSTSPSIHDYYKKMDIYFTAPLHGMEESKMLLFSKDSLTEQFQAKIDKLRGILSIHTKWKPNEKYKLLLLPGAIRDIYGRMNDSITANFQTNSPESFSSLKLEIKTDKKGQKLIQLLDQAENVVHEKVLNGNFIRFNHLQSGNYRIKLIFDQNRNKKWDTGNYLKKQSAEKAVLFDGIINLRTNWEKEIIWELK